MKLPSKKKMISFIGGVLDSADEKEKESGLYWYAEALRQCRSLSEKFNIPVPAVVGTVAALSPGRNWEKNLYDAETFLNDFARGLRARDLPLVGSYGWRNVEKAERICLGQAPQEALGGDKVQSFFYNIMYPTNETVVTIDRHAASVACGMKLGEKDLKISSSVYARIAEAYLTVAAERQLLGQQVQAITWVVWRNRNA